jgi:hypothetical protein
MIPCAGGFWAGGDDGGIYSYCDIFDGLRLQASADLNI